MVKSNLETDLASMKMGSPEDMSNFITAVISKASFDKLHVTLIKLKTIAMQKLSWVEITTNQKGISLNQQLS